MPPDDMQIVTRDLDIKVLWAINRALFKIIPFSEYFLFNTGTYLSTHNLNYYLSKTQVIPELLNNKKKRLNVSPDAVIA